MNTIAKLAVMSHAVNMKSLLVGALVAILAAPRVKPIKAVPSDRPRVNAIERELGRWLKRLNDPHSQQILLATTGDPFKSAPTGAARVAAMDRWPENTLETFILALDEKGRLRFLQTEPTSQSGDWALRYLYLFDGRGQTIFFERFYSSFCSDSNAILKETVTTFIETGRILRRRVSLTDGKGAAISGPGCEIIDRDIPEGMVKDAAHAFEDERVVRLALAAGMR